MAASWYKQKQKQKSVNVCTVCSRKHCLQLSQALGWVFFLMPIHRFSLKFRHKQEANFRDFKLGETECHCTTLTSSTCSGLLFCFSFAPFLPSFLWEKLLTPMLRPISGQITDLIIHTPENLLKIHYGWLITSLITVQIPCEWVWDFVGHEQVLGKHQGSKTFELLPVVSDWPKKF